MIRVHHIRGNLLTAHLTYPQIGLVAQQLNCYSPRPHGLAATFVETRAWSWANHYGKRRAKGSLNVCVAQDADKPGTIIILSQPRDLTQAPLPVMAGLFGQECMGKPSDYKERHPDFKVGGTCAARLQALAHFPLPPPQVMLSAARAALKPMDRNKKYARRAIACGL
jgi:hypothetical protein